MLKTLLALSMCAAAAFAQSPLTTTFANNNNGSVGGAVYYDLTAAVDITLTQLDLHFTATAGTAGSVSVYTIPGGTWSANAANAAAWTLTSTATITAAGVGQPSIGMLSPPIPMTAGTTLAVAIAATNFAHTYTTGTAPFPLVYSNAELTINCGGASNVPFTGAPFTPRVLNTNHHYVLGANGMLASNTTLGVGCIRSFASFYENFATAGALDLANSSLQAISTGSGFVALAGGSYLPVGTLGTPTVLALTDDSQVAAGSLGLTVGSNGWVALGAGNSNAFTPDVPTFLANPSSAWYCWHDFNPTIAGSGTVKYEQAGSLAMVTFDGVWDFGGSSAANANFLQFQIDTSTGNVVIAWQTMSTSGNGFLVGYSPGGANLDPGSSNLSDVTSGLSTIQTSSPDVLPLTLTASTRPVLGTNWNLNVTNIPAGALFGATIYGLSDPNIPDLAFLGLPGCPLRASLDVILAPWFAAGSYSHTFPIPAMPMSLVGFSVYAQDAAFAPGVNSFGAVITNGIQGTLGDL